MEATRDIKQASAFFVFPNEDGGHPYEFIIGYYGDSRKILKQQMSTLSYTPWPEMDPIPRYLHAPVGVLGNNFGPLYLNKTRVGVPFKTHSSQPSSQALQSCRHRSMGG